MLNEATKDSSSSHCSLRFRALIVFNGAVAALFTLLGVAAAVASVYFIVVESSTFQFFQ